LFERIAAPVIDSLADGRFFCRRAISAEQQLNFNFQTFLVALHEAILTKIIKYIGKDLKNVKADLLCCLL
jgi:hypothetical protein